MAMLKELHVTNKGGIWRDSLRQGQIKDGKFFDHNQLGYTAEELRKIADLLDIEEKKNNPWKCPRCGDGRMGCMCY